MESVHFTYREVTTYLIIANVILGILFGVFPLIAGLKLNNRKYGFIGLGGAVLGGALFGVLLSFPVAAIFSWLIIRGPAVDGASASGFPNSPSDPH